MTNAFRPSPDAIAITGYGCRLPGAENIDAFWDLLIDGRLAVGPVPSDRWDNERFHHPGRAMPGMSYTMQAGLLDDVWAFDPGFFGISPREAEQMDPQQRVLLEVVWEAIEHAFLTADEIAAKRCGVFIGAASMDHSLVSVAEPGVVGSNFMTGNTLSILSNRISYAFDLKGASYTVDTACSSSFYALHQAAQALRQGEIDTAIVGGVNMVLSPFHFVGFSRAAMLSPDGLCKAFDASANGYVRGEGAVAFVLRRADTLSGHEPVRSELLGTGVNSDGRTVGLSMPSEPDQARLLGRIYDDLGVDPDHLAFVEAHGTGTHVGDPIEARAIGTVLGQGRSRRLPIGSAKTNVGHLEAASGLVGLLKAQLALDHGRLPPSLHFNEPNPEIDFDGLNLTVASSPVEIDLAGADGGAPWIAGVNSFGFGGANAHAVLRQAKSAQADTVIPAAPPPPLLLSAASQASLRALANRWRERLTNCPALEAASLISANARLRTRHTHRAVLTSQGTDLTVALDALAAGEAHPAIQTGEAPERSGKTAFVFCGNGAQYADMGRELFDGDTAYRDGFLRVAKTFRRLSGIDLVKLMDDPDLAEKLDHGLVGQPLLLALQIALVEALAARGVRPDAVAGHSVGEVAAAWTAGCLSLTDACRLIHARAAAMEALRGEGGMAAVLAGAEAAEQALSEMGFETLDLAGDNSPRSSTVSGPAEDIAAFLKAAKSRRLAARPIPVSYPYHGPALEVIRDDLIAGLSALRPKPGTIPVFSSTTGAQVEGRAMDADYWWHNARDRVRFREAIVGLAEFGASTFVEIAPRPQLQTYVNDTVRSLGKKASVIPTLDTSARAPRDLVTITARAVANGAREDEAAFFGPERGPVTDLPRYAWNHAAYRIEVGENGVDLLGRRPSHPLLGWQVRQGEGVWRSELDMLKRPWLGDHVVDGAAVLPGAAFVEIALAAGAEFYDAAQVELADFDILAPLVLEESESQTTTVRTRLELETGIIRIESRPYQSSQDWVLHARGTVKRAIDPASEVPAHPGLALLPEWPGARLYALLDAAGLSYGPVFQRVRRLRAGGGWAEAELDPVAEVERYQIHPAMLDSAFHAIFPLIAAELSDRDSESGAASGLDAGETYVPVRFGRVLSLSPGTAPERADLNLVRLTEHGAEVALTLRDGSGRGLIRLEGLRLQKIRLKIGRSQPPILWQQRLIPHAGPETEAASGAAWSAAAERLEVIGLAAPDLPEPAAGALIVDAGFRRVAWDALAALADGDGRLPARPAGMAEEALPLYHAMRIALEEDDVVVQVDEDAILLDCPYPRLDELTDALISEAPERAADLMNLIRAATTLGQRLAEGPDAAAIDPVPGHVPWQRDLVDALARAAEDYAACLEDGVRLDILLIGAAPPSFVRRLIETAQPTRLILSDPEAPRVEWLRATLDPNPALTILDWDQAIASGGVDLVISAEGLGRVGRPRMAVLGDLLRPGGLLLAAERLPELGADLTQGLSAQWWSETIVPEAPLGRLSTGEEWAHALTGAGFEGAVARPLACQDVAASLITARRSTETVEQAPGVKPKTVLLGHGLGEDTLEQAFSAMGWSTERAEVADLAGRLCDVASEADAEIVAALQLDSQGGLPLDHLRSLIAASGRVWIIAEQGAPGHTRPENGSIWGLVRVAMNEAPGCDIRLIDADPSLQAAEIAAIIADPGEEREWVLSPAGPAVPRVEAVAMPARRPEGDPAPTLNLGLARPGALDTLEWQPAERRAPGPDEIEIEIAATGLNFRDVMWAQRLLPAEALEDGFAGPTLGMECAGTVTRAGNASGFEPGDRVIAFAAQAFASHATLPALAASRLPEETSFETGAALPTIFLTAHYALVELARLSPGETVLIHGGAGGVGLAALQIARSRGAVVYATAGNPLKRRMLELLGAEAVFDSRSLRFTHELRAATEGEGVDVVLNSLAGEAMIRSLDLVRPFGRFIELGKQDYYANSRLGLRPFRRNISYFGVDADQLVSVRPELAERMFADLATRFADGSYTAPPIQVYAHDEVVDAFRLMQKSDHIGKVVVRAPEVPSGTLPVERSLGTGAWLISGGLGGLGLATAEWLIEQGVRTVWLISRSGRPRAEIAGRLNALRQRADVRIIAADVTDTAAMADAIGKIAVDGGRLEGVVHAAMVLEDALIADLTLEAANRVLKPKVEGARVLDELTRPLAPAHFVLFSSVTSLFGNPGQAAYVAANTALESLAHQRRAEGLPALAIGWGPIADQGYLAREEDLRDQLERQLKGGLMQTAEVLEAFGRLIRAPETPASVAYAPMRWGTLAGDLATVGAPLFERVDRTVQQGPASAQDFLDEIAGLDDGPARDRIIAALVAETARILRQPEGEIDAYRPMTELGFDSLMAVDLKLSAEEQLGISLPLMSLGEQMTLADLAIKVLGRIRSGQAAQEEAEVDNVVARHVGIAGLDDQVVEEVLSGVNRTGRGPAG